MIYRFFIWMLPALIMTLMLIWYLLCTKHDQIPLLLALFMVAFGYIPVLGWFTVCFSIWILINLVDSDGIKLKDNWFNRTFLAYHAE